MTAESHHEAISEALRRARYEGDGVRRLCAELAASGLAILPTGGAYAEAVLSDVTPAEIERAADVWDKFRGHVIVADGLRHIFREFIANRRASIPDASETPIVDFAAGMRKAAEIASNHYATISQSVADDILAAIPASPAQISPPEIDLSIGDEQDEIEAATLSLNEGRFLPSMGLSISGSVDTWREIMKVALRAAKSVRKPAAPAPEGEIEAMTKHWECGALKAGSPGGADPQDCNWPFCGCDPKAQKVLDAIDASGYAVVNTLHRRDAPREPTEAMLIAARDWSAKYVGHPIGNEAATGCWQAMFDGSLASIRSRPAAEPPKEPQS